MAVKNMGSYVTGVYRTTTDNPNGRKPGPREDENGLVKITFVRYRDFAYGSPDYRDDHLVTVTYALYPEFKSSAGPAMNGFFIARFEPIAGGVSVYPGMTLEATRPRRRRANTVYVHRLSYRPFGAVRVCALMDVYARGLV